MLSSYLHLITISVRSDTSEEIAAQDVHSLPRLSPSSICELVVFRSLQEVFVWSSFETTQLICDDSKLHEQDVSVEGGDSWFLMKTYSTIQIVIGESERIHQAHGLR